MREGIKRNKEFYFKGLIDKLDNVTYSPEHLVRAASGDALKLISQTLRETAALKKKKKEEKRAKL